MIQHISAGSPTYASVFARGWAWLAAIWQQSEPIELVEQRFNFLPDRFRWRGDMRRVRAVTRVWEWPSDGVRPARRYFEVRCGRDQSFVLFQDVHIGTWHMSV